MLKVVQVGEGLGLILPEEVLSVLGVKEGDELILTPEAGTLGVTPSDPKVRAQLEAAREIMHRRHNALDELSKR